MPVLIDIEREALWAEMMRELSDRGESVGVTKADLRAALNAADGWADANATSYNSALPQPARGALSARQKAMLLTWVVRRRWELG